MPFTQSQFLDVFAGYNDALWPAAFVLWIASLGAALCVLICRDVPHRAVSLLLAALWAWSAVAYHAVFFTRINPIAWVFAAGFLAQAVLFLRTGVRQDRLRFSRARSIRHIAAGGFIVYALTYPALVLLEGLTFPRMPTYGVPCPTVLLTAGFLLIAERRQRLLVIIPAAWALMAGSSALVLEVRTDFALLAAAGALAADQLRRMIEPGVSLRPRGNVADAA